MRRPTAALLPLLALAALLPACSPIVVNRGNTVDPPRLAQIAPGRTKAEVASILGTPTMVAPFERNTWYYVGQRTEQNSFNPPEATQRRIVKVTFDEGGRVLQVAEQGLEGARDVNPIDRETPTSGRDLGFFEQLLGTLGRGIGRAGEGDRGGS